MPVNGQKKKAVHGQKESQAVAEMPGQAGHVSSPGAQDMFLYSVTNSLRSYNQHKLVSVTCG